MNAILKDFAAHADSNSVNRLVALSAVVDAIPTEKMSKLQKIKLSWRELKEELLPELEMEFFQ
jgi:hypothetical protein